MKKNCISLLTALFLAAILFALPVSAVQTYTEGDWISRLRALHDSTYGEDLYRWLGAQAELAKDNQGAFVTITEGKNGITKSNDGNNTMLVHSVQTLTVTNLNNLSEEEKRERIRAAADPVEDMIANVLNAFRMDHPEINWLNNVTRIGWSASIQNGTATVNVFLILKVDASSASDRYDIRTTTSPALSGLIQRANDVLDASGARDAVSDEEAIRALNTWLTKNNAYSTASSFTDAHRDPIVALTGKSGTNGPICESYAKAFKILCDLMDIPCVLIAGDATNASGASGAHMWNYVRMDNGKWYGVDVTWNDPTVAGRESSATSGFETDRYLLSGQRSMPSHSSVNYLNTTHIVAFGNAPALSELDYKDEPKASYTISGTVTPAGGSTTITLLNSRGETVYSGVIHAGSYSLTVTADPGEYTLKVERPKYVTRTYTITLGGN